MAKIKAPPPDAPVASSAAEFVPPVPTLSAMREAARACRGCPLFKTATQVVFGEGEATARVVLVGEQPGNEEDKSGHPFVGPAGRVLDEALARAGIDRADAYVTNVVKHFKWVPNGKRRLHKKPSTREIRACRPWLDHELEILKPQVLVCLGATAAQALLGAGFRVTAQRGEVPESTLAPHVVATVHPSSILRQQSEEDRRRELDRFVEDLRLAASLLEPARRRR